MKNKQVSLSQEQQDAVVEVYQSLHRRHNHHHVTGETFRMALGECLPVKKRFNYFLIICVLYAVVFGLLFILTFSRTSHSAIATPVVCPSVTPIPPPTSSIHFQDTTVKTIHKDARTAKEMRAYKREMTQYGSYGYDPKPYPLVDTLTILKSHVQK